MGKTVIEKELKKIWWMDGRSLENTSIEIIERRGSTQTTKIIELNKGTIVMKDRLVIGDKVIPFHRIITIIHRGKVVWRRRGYA